MLKTLLKGWKTRHTSRFSRGGKPVLNLVFHKLLKTFPYNSSDKAGCQLGKAPIFALDFPAPPSELPKVCQGSTGCFPAPGRGILGGGKRWKVFIKESFGCIFVQHTGVDSMLSQQPWHSLGDARGLDLDATLTSGQCFRWQRQNGTWQGVSGGHAVQVKLEDGRLLADCPADQDDWVAPLFCAGHGLRRAARPLCQKPAAGRPAWPPRRDCGCCASPFSRCCAAFSSARTTTSPGSGASSGGCATSAARRCPTGSGPFPPRRRWPSRRRTRWRYWRAGWRADYLLAAARAVAEGKLRPEHLAAPAAGPGPGPADDAAGGGAQGGGLRAAVRAGLLGCLAVGCVDEAGNACAVSQRHAQSGGRVPGALPSSIFSSMPGAACPGGADKKGRKKPAAGPKRTAVSGG